MKKIILSVLAVLLVVGLSACSSPEKTLKGALENSANLKSYEFDMSAGLKLDVPETNDPFIGPILAMLSDLEISSVGVIDQDKEHIEMVLTLKLNGDMQMAVDVPIIVNGKEVYVKLPNTPFAPLPSELQDKFIAFNLDELEAQGLQIQGTTSSENIDVEVATQLSVEVMTVIIDDFADFINKVKEIPTGVDAKELVEIKVTHKDLKGVSKTFVTSTLPKIIDIIDKDEYQEILGLTDEDIAEAKEEVNAIELTEANYKELDEAFTLNEATVRLGVNKDNFISYQQIYLDAVVKDTEEIGIKLDVKSSTKNINKEQNFKLPIPTEDEIVDYTELFYTGIGEAGF